MRPGVRAPGFDNLFNAEIKHGAKKKRRFEYLIEGEKYELGEVLKRTQAVGLNDATVVRRLMDHHSHTWEELLRPADSRKLKDPADRLRLIANAAKRKAKALALRKAAAEKRAYFAAKKLGHKEL